MIRGITEVGIAVRDLASATRLLAERLGAVVGPVQRFEPYGMEFCMCRVGNVDFEVMAPLDDSGVIARFLARRGEGLHHIGFAVDDVVASQAQMTQRGLAFVQDSPRRQRFLVSDFTGEAVNAECSFTFSRPDSLLGLLLEFIEYPPGFALTPASTGKQERNP